MRQISKLLSIVLVSLFVFSCGNTTDTKKVKETTNSKETVQEKASIWEHVPVKDEFGDIIEGKTLLVARVKGKMTNSAVADAELLIEMQVSDSTIYTAFYEYGTEPRAELPHGVSLPIKVKLPNGEIIDVKEFLANDVMIDFDKELINVLFNETQPIKVIADISKADKYESSVYQYTIDPYGLKELIK